MKIDFEILYDDYEDGDIICVITRGIVRADIARVSAASFLADELGQMHGLTVGGVHHRKYRRVPRGDRGDQFIEGNGRGASAYTVVDLKYAT